MDDATKARVRRWKAGMEEMNALILEEKRNRTPAERLKLLQAFLDGHAQIGIARRKPEDRKHFMPYAEVQERLSARRP